MANESKHKVIVMAQSPLTIRWASYFCTDALSQAFDMEYWDCSRVAYPAFAAPEVLERPYSITILSMDHLRTNLQRLPSDTLLLSDIHCIKQNISFHKLVGKYISNCISLDMWCYSLGMLPLVDEDKPKVKEEPKSSPFKQWLYRFYMLRLLIKFVRNHGDVRFKQQWHLYLQEQSIKKEEAEIRACQQCYKNLFQITSRPHQTYSIHHPDAEQYLRLSQQPPTRTDRYVVYLDQYFPLHPDSDEMEPEVNHAALAPEFFQSINRFFAEVEKQLDCKIVIAAHPVADYSNNPFEGREVIYYKTAELVRDSIGVCLHHTASANFIALFDKPFVLLECNATRQSPRFTRNMAQFAHVLHAPVINMDESCAHIESYFKPMERTRRQAFLDSFFDADNKLLNGQLIPMHLEAIYKEINKELENKRVRVLEN